MTHAVIVEYTLAALTLVLVLSMPAILVATIVGLLISFLQAITQIQEQTLSFAVRLMCVSGVLVLTAYWMGNELYLFALKVFDTMWHLS